MTDSQWLKDMEMLKALTDEDRRILAGVIREKTFEKGQILYLEDQPGGDLYFIKKGKIRIFRKGPKKKDVELATMGPGRVFGEMTFFDRGDHTANIAALEDSVFGILNIDLFEKMALEHPSLAYAFTKELFLEFQKLLRKMNDRYLSMMKMMHFLGSD